jgi:PhzF family phenazine biosynthesis protein
MRIKIKQVDAFSDTPFGGNPAGVITDAFGINDNIKQKIAKEMNLSETAFVSPSEVADFKVQFFTPRSEVDLCGHATIGAFSALYEEGQLDKNKTVFYQETKAGILPVELFEIEGKKVFTLTQAKPIFEEVPIDRQLLASAFSLSEQDLIDAPIMKVSTGIWWLVFGVKDLNKLVNAKPNLSQIESLSSQYNLAGITPFCLDSINKTYNYHMRAIAPILGIAEDPVCGTGNGCVASYIAYNNLINFKNSINLIGEEGNEVDRPGSAYITIEKKDNIISRIKVGGTALTILEGNLTF